MVRKVCYNYKNATKNRGSNTEVQIYQNWIESLMLKIFLASTVSHFPLIKLKKIHRFAVAQGVYSDLLRANRFSFIEYWAMRMIISERGCLICLSKLIPDSPNLDSNSKGLNLEIIL